MLTTTLGDHAVKTICSSGDNDNDRIKNGGFVTWNGENVEVVLLENVSGVPSKTVTAECSEFVATGRSDGYLLQK